MILLTGVDTITIHSLRKYMEASSTIRKIFIYVLDYTFLRCIVKFYENMTIKRTFQFVFLCGFGWIETPRIRESAMNVCACLLAFCDDLRSWHVKYWPRIMFSFFRRETRPSNMSTRISHLGLNNNPWWIMSGSGRGSASRSSEVKGWHSSQHLSNWRHPSDNRSSPASGATRGVQRVRTPVLSTGVTSEAPKHLEAYRNNALFFTMYPCH